jgi:predicted TPR repeat methyltransferase
VTETAKHREKISVKTPSGRATANPDRFDKAYYDRFYRNPSTRAVTPAATRRQATFIAAYLRYLDVTVQTITDVGCGTGVLLRALNREFPKARATGVEFSEYLCRTYGWTRGSVADYLPEEQSDLVVCNDVLGYLNDGDCERALRNLTTAACSALYLGVLTTEDLALCDPSRTDQEQITRPVAWYFNRLQRDFQSVGGGLFLRKPLDVTVWHLERG